MTTQVNETLGDEIVRKVLVATVVSIAAGIIGTILAPGIGTALGIKLGALYGGSSSS